MVGNARNRSSPPRSVSEVLRCARVVLWGLSCTHRSGDRSKRLKRLTCASRNPSIQMVRGPSIQMVLVLRALSFTPHH